MNALLPHAHLDLLDRPLLAALTTQMPDGRLQSTVVWCGRDGDQVLLNTMREFQKARNMQARPRATVLVLDPDDATRWLEVRGGVVPDEYDPVARLDELGRTYTGKAPYFGEVVPAELSAVEHPVGFRLVPTRVCTGPGPAQREQAIPDPSPQRPPAREASSAETSPAPVPRGCDGEARIPDSHRALLQRPLPGALSTRLPDGAAQTHPVWFGLDGNDVLVNTTLERRKGRNLVADPRATLLVVDPDDGSRWLEIRGDVELVQDGALDHLDELTRRYTSHARYYGRIRPAGQRRLETRVIARIHPQRVVADAVHA